MASLRNICCQNVVSTFSIPVIPAVSWVLNRTVMEV
jgi:hypothetical protein